MQCKNTVRFNLYANQQIHIKSKQYVIKHYTWISGPAGGGMASSIIDSGWWGLDIN